METQITGHPGHPKYRPEIDGLRCIAVLAVIGFHAFPSIIPGGFVGVDIFFVISGFLISSILLGSLENNRFSIVDFYSRRVRRIFPALLLVLCACFVLQWFELLVDDRPFGKHVAGGAFFVSNFLLWRESGYFDSSADMKPLLHLWSLAIEEQFYILWPAILYILWHLKLRLSGVILVLLVCASLLANILLADSDATSAFYSPATRFWELMIGSILAGTAWFPTWGGLGRAGGKVLVPGGSSRFSQAYAAEIAGLLGAVLIGICIFGFSKGIPFPGWRALFPSIGTGLVIWAGSNSIISQKILSRRFFVGIGLISYPLYLWHWPLLSFARIRELGEVSVEYRLGLVAMGFVFAWLTFQFLERPMRFGAYAKAKTLIFCGLLTIIGILGLSAYRSGSMPFERYRANFQKDYATLRQLLSYNYLNGQSEEEFWGENSCFNLSAGFSLFEKNHCYSGPNRELPQVFLVGDSHSAYLMQGLKDEFTRRQIPLGQFSTAFCPPLTAEQTTPRCVEISEGIFREIGRISPELVLLFYNYIGYESPGAGKAQADMRTTMLDTANRMRELGVRRVILIGQIPTWKDTLPHALFKVLRSFGILPQRMPYFVTENSVSMDAKMKKPGYPAGVRYLSLKDALCDAGGCLTMVGNNLAEDLIVFDYGHLTRHGAQYIAEQVVYPSLENNNPPIR